MENKEVENAIDIINEIEGDEYCKKQVIDYIEQLEKENTELKKNRGTDDTVCSLIYAYMMKWKQEIADLKKQLQAKDKALNKACKKMAYIVQLDDTCEEYKCNRKACDGICNNNCNNAIDWKQWCEEDGGNI